MIRLLRRHVPSVSRLLVALLVFQAGQAGLMLYLPHVSASIVNQGILAHDMGYIWTHGSWMLLVAAGQLLCMAVSVYLAARVAMSIGRDVRRDLFHRVIHFSAQEVGQFGAPTLITRVTNDVQQVQIAVVMMCSQAVVAPLTAVFGTVLALQQDRVLALVLVASIPTFALIIGTLMSRIHPYMMAMQDRIDDVNDVMRQQITGMRVVRAFVREDAERQRFGTANGSLTATSLGAGRRMAALFPLILLVQNLASIAIVWFGAHRVASHAMTVGSMFAFLGYIIQVLAAVMMGLFMFVLLPRAAVAGRRIMEVLESESSVQAPVQPVTQVLTRGTLELRGVTFRYPGALEPVIAGVSFAARPGETTAIVGSTGAGKTTLLHLIARQMDTSAGSVLVDGIDVRQHAPKALTSRVGLVPQRPFLFSGTVASNLRYGKADASEEEMWEALGVAQADDFVRVMPGGLEAVITQGGGNVSGGQRQRLAIARALIGKPEIYLFDDSFSALDLATDSRLRAALVPYTASATVVIVAQRISTILTAQRIVVLEEGRPVGIGTHRELLATCPTYAEIVASQLSTEEAA